MVVIEMENGKKIEIELYPEIAPISCELRKTGEAGLL